MEENKTKVSDLEPKKDNVKFAYLQDFLDTDRILTLARTIVNKGDDGVLVINVGWSLNKTPNANVVESCHTLGMSLAIHYEDPFFDRYNKAEGKARALERLENNPFSVVVAKDEKPYDTVLNHLTGHSNFYVRRVARQHYMYRMNTKNLKAGTVVQGSSNFVVFDKSEDSSNSTTTP